MQNFSASPIRFIRTLFENKYLLYMLLRREVLGRYQGSMFGILWSFFNPVLMLAIYTFVFSVVFKARWHANSISEPSSKTEFALLLFAGLLVFNLFSESVARSPTLILGNVNYVKKVVFPLELIPLVNVLAALFHFAVGLSVWMLAYIIIFGLPPITILAMPFILLSSLMMVLGFSWVLSSIGVFLRDISQVVSVLITVMMFMSPIFYPVSALPAAYQGLFMLNPLTSLIEMARGSLFFATWPSLEMITVSMMFNFSFAFFGLYCFQRLRREFADVL